MPWVTRNLRQTATRWTIASKDIYGKPTYTRSSVKCRWEDNMRKSVDTQGVEFISSAMVWLPIDISVGDYLFLGTSTATAPPDDAREVGNFGKIPNIKATQFERKAVLR